MPMEAWNWIVAVVMVAATLISFVPGIPGPALVWAVGTIYAIATEFQVVSLETVIVMSVLMLIGSTADWWTKLLGLSAEGNLTCGTWAVSMVGAVLGTIFIPIPLIGTLAGAGLAVLALVYYQQGDMDKAMAAARGILSAWIASFFVEFVVSIGIVALYIRAVLTV